MTNLLLRELIHNGKFSMKDAENFASDVAKHIRDEFEISNNECTSIRRFLICTLKYMDLELNREEFTIESLYKLLRCVYVEDGDYKKDQSVYDILLQDTYEEHDILYHLHRVFNDMIDCFPEDAEEKISKSIDSYFAVREDPTEDEDKTQEEMLENALNIIADFLNSLEDLQCGKNVISYDDLHELLDDACDETSFTRMFEITEKLHGVATFYEFMRPVYDSMKKQERATYERRPLSKYEK